MLNNLTQKPVLVIVFFDINILKLYFAKLTFIVYLMQTMNMFKCGISSVSL